MSLLWFGRSDAPVNDMLGFAQRHTQQLPPPPRSREVGGGARVDGGCPERAPHCPCPNQRLPRPVGKAAGTATCAIAPNPSFPFLHLRPSPNPTQAARVPRTPPPQIQPLKNVRSHRFESPPPPFRELKQPRPLRFSPSDIRVGACQAPRHLRTPNPALGPDTESPPRPPTLSQARGVSGSSRGRWTPGGWDSRVRGRSWHRGIPPAPAPAAGSRGRGGAGAGNRLDDVTRAGGRRVPQGRGGGAEVATSTLGLVVPQWLGVHFTDRKGEAGEPGAIWPARPGGNAWMPPSLWLPAGAPRAPFPPRPGCWPLERTGTSPKG